MDITLEQYTGSHRDLEWSFRAADGEVIGHLQVVPRDEEVWDVTNTAVVESQRGRGAGRALLERAVDEARAAGVRRMIVATGAADVGNLRFYQRCGFRMTRVVKDVFTPVNGYP